MELSVPVKKLYFKECKTISDSALRRGSVDVSGCQYSNALQLNLKHMLCDIRLSHQSLSLRVASAALSRTSSLKQMMIIPVDFDLSAVSSHV